MKPILFNIDMVCAILEGRKTVTRRVVKIPNTAISMTVNSVCIKDGKAHFGWSWAEGISGFDVAMPYRPGDILWVRESFCPLDDDHVVDGIKYAYKADATPESERARKDFGYKWCPSIHMPREAARIFLRVKKVRVERLQEITHEGIAKEGIVTIGSPGSQERVNPFFAFRNLWNTTIKPSDRAFYGWDVNPWVWVIEFEKISKENINERIS